MHAYDTWLMSWCFLFILFLSFLSLLLDSLHYNSPSTVSRTVSARATFTFTPALPTTMYVNEPRSFTFTPNGTPAAGGVSLGFTIPAGTVSPNPVMYTTNTGTAVILTGSSTAQTVSYTASVSGVDAAHFIAPTMGSITFVAQAVFNLGVIPAILYSGQQFPLPFTPSVTPAVGGVSLFVSIQSGTIAVGGVYSWTTATTQSNQVTVTGGVGATVIMSCVVGGTDRYHYAAPMNITRVIQAQATFNIVGMPAVIYGKTQIL